MLSQLPNLTSLDEKWLLVPQLRVGHLCKERLALAGHAQLNLHSKSWPQIARELAGPSLAKTNCMLVGNSAIAMVIQCSLAQLEAAGKLAYFRRVASSTTNSTASLARLLATTRYDLRMSGVDPTQLGDDVCEVPAKAADLRAIYAHTETHLKTAGWVDQAWCFQQAIDDLACGQVSIPKPLQILQPEQFPTLALETRLLSQLISCGAIHYPDWQPLTKRGKATVSVQSAIGPTNEIRGVLQQIIGVQHQPLPLDTVEIVYTDYEQYVPLLMEYGLGIPASGSKRGVGEVVGDALNAGASSYEELNAGASSYEENNAGAFGYEEMPMTLAEGIACVYSRPGRLLRSWVRWMVGGYHQTKAVEVVREGLLRRPSAAEQCGYARMANTLRGLPIGLGLSRYQDQIDQAIQEAQRRRDDDLQQRSADATPRDFGLANLTALRATVQPLIALADRATGDSLSILQAARELLDQSARADSQLDRLARAKLIDEIELMIQLLGSLTQESVDVLGWLETLPTTSRILAQSPQPGKLHIAPLDQGGNSGREQVFVIGLSDRLHPRLQSMDPILLDHERQLCDIDLPTSRDVNAYQLSALDRVLTRLAYVPNAHVSLSYSQRDLIEDRLSSPSYVVTEYERGSDRDPIGFVDAGEQPALLADDLQWRRILTETNYDRRQAWLLARYPHLRARHVARQAIASQQFTAYDGWVPQAGHDAAAQLADRAFSPSRLEVLGACPRRYFFQRTLGIYPPDQYTVDPDRWLSPLEFGSLLHELLEDFVRQSIVGARANRAIAASAAMATLVKLLDQLLEKWAQRVPPPGPQSFSDTREELLTTCEIFMKAEEVYAREHQAQPVHLEIALGTSIGERTTSDIHAPSFCEWDTDQPISVTLSDERVIKLIGRVDRVDLVSTSEGQKYLIWDYKSGSSYGYTQDKPFDQGRHLQPLLYVRMLQARLAQLGQDAEAVHGFGYFFPTQKTEGLRIQWLTRELIVGDRIISSLLDLLVAGTFIATDREKDCIMCDYSQVCGPPDQLVLISKHKSSVDANVQLTAWQHLRRK